jgi:hypothetical protein
MARMIFQNCLGIAGGGPFVGEGVGMVTLQLLLAQKPCPNVD